MIVMNPDYRIGCNMLGYFVTENFVYCNVGFPILLIIVHIA